MHKSTHVQLDQVTAPFRRLAASRGQERAQGEAGEGEGGREHRIHVEFYTIVGFALSSSLKEAERESEGKRARGETAHALVR
jgi:hypothetical protein